ncbi:unnamed protein product [Ostreobium quekettii]|uniref:phosphoribosylaminoimidazole carboxylase n=1 Tax=Ostreobium quekettii TaxID=121088 RepID=A0A8S1J0G1_9CHLO|nr:unnamed protein product [Ostreobium quekettii]|eukprot:evm.model.scf_34EXC.8 EVM.evm.TU.scf_34EXC.8   scf_34EXC:123248-135312(-)
MAGGGPSGEALTREYEKLRHLHVAGREGVGAWFWRHMSPILIKNDGGAPKEVKLQCEFCKKRFSARNPSRTAKDHLKSGACSEFQKTEEFAEMRRKGSAASVGGRMVRREDPGMGDKADGLGIPGAGKRLRVDSMGHGLAGFAMAPPCPPGAEMAPGHTMQDDLAAECQYAATLLSIGREDNGATHEDLVHNRVVGVLGGGQLGRMLALAAARLGVRIRTLDPIENAPSSSVGAEHIVGSYQDREKIMEFAQGCDVVTVEIEHINTEALEDVRSELGINVHPSPETLRIVQDKFTQKQHLMEHNIPVTQCVEINTPDDLQNACANGYPVMLKARRLAYDGRGSYLISSAEQLDEAVETLGGYSSGLYAEQWVSATKELAVTVTRTREGHVLSFPVVETIHKEDVCFVTEAPANVPHEVATEARTIAERAVACLDGAGVFGVELFWVESGPVILNEIAPRPHNAGHYTMDACQTSQFEQHLRAVLGWPLSDPSMTYGCCVMYNIVGEDDGEEGLKRAQALLARARGLRGAHVHWYGKEDVAKKLKIGHINIVAGTREEAREQLGALDPMAAHSLQATDVRQQMPNGHPSQAVVGIIMGSDSDLPTMAPAAEVLEDHFGVPCEVKIVSAHRTPERMVEYAKTAHIRGIKVIIAGAGGAAHLPGMVAAMTPLPVIGVPMTPEGAHLDGLDALMSIAQMADGVPVATVAIGNATNAGLLAIRILAANDNALLQSMMHYQENMKKSVTDKAIRLEEHGWKSYKK